ncbi:MAG TPA: symmetrical bis(5'-nucleosyl)-tetraphosphatase [Gammaproteobacteria bacterium]|jgi:bis(5'-nucleosyl)-tetraphosphatase (symmetrical)
MTLYAIGDIQGCARSFEALLKRIKFKRKRDHLWLVGDLVNRGPDSVGVLRMIRQLGDSVTCVLGNHDLHLLATAAGVRSQGSGDTFDDVLNASDAEDLLDWLRTRPLLVRDRSAKRALVHAGIPPVWKVRDAVEHAGEIEALLAGKRWAKALGSMYGNTPTAWSPDLAPKDRQRFTINALTRIRFCDRRGRLDLYYSGPPGSQPAKLVPWFDVPKRRARKWHVVFGHWSALGVLRRKDITALDSGCVWGWELTAVPLDPPGEPIDVSCADD